MPSLSKMLPVLALMMVGDARAAPAKFTTKNALQQAINKCEQVSDEGICCLRENLLNAPSMVYTHSTDINNQLCYKTSSTFISFWDVSEIDDMSTRELTFVVSSPLCPPRLRRLLVCSHSLLPVSFV